MEEIKSLAVNYVNHHKELKKQMFELKFNYTKAYYKLCREILKNNGFHLNYKNQPLINLDAHEDEIKNMLHKLVDVCDLGFHWNFIFMDVLLFTITTPENPIIKKLVSTIESTSSNVTGYEILCKYLGRKKKITSPYYGDLDAITMCDSDVSDDEF